MFKFSLYSYSNSDVLLRSEYPDRLSGPVFHHLRPADQSLYRDHRRGKRQLCGGSQCNRRKLPAVCVPGHHSLLPARHCLLGALHDRDQHPKLHPHRYADRYRHRLPVRHVLQEHPVPLRRSDRAVHGGAGHCHREHFQ